MKYLFKNNYITNWLKSISKSVSMSRSRSRSRCEFKNMSFYFLWPYWKPRQYQFPAGHNLAWILYEGDVNLKVFYIFCLIFPFDIYQYSAGGFQAAFDLTIISWLLPSPKFLSPFCQYIERKLYTTCQPPHFVMQTKLFLISFTVLLYEA